MWTWQSNRSAGTACRTLSTLRSCPGSSACPAASKSLDPRTGVLIAVRPPVGADARPLVILDPTAVALAVGPGVAPFAFHEIVAELPRVPVAGRPDIRAAPVEVPGAELALVGRAIRIRVHAGPVIEIVLELAGVPAVFGGDQGAPPRFFAPLGRGPGGGAPAPPAAAPPPGKARRGTPPRTP